MNIGEILTRAWNIVWKHKVLWLFGILASCGQAGSSSNGGSSGGGSGGSQAMQLPSQWLADIGNMEWFVVLLLVVGGVLAILLLVFIMMSLNTVGRVGVVRGALQAEEGKEKLAFGELLSGVKPFFWRILGLNLLIGASVFAVVFLGVLVLIFIAVITFGIGLLALLPLILLFIPLMWAVVVVQEQANVALIVEDTGILDALRRAWQVVMSKPGNYVVMGLVLILGVGLLALLVIGLPMLPVLVPMIIGFIVGDATAINTGLILSGVCFVIYLPILLALVGLMRSYTITTWTLSYLRWSGGTMVKPAVIAPTSETRPAPPVETLPNPLTGN